MQVVTCFVMSRFRFFFRFRFLSLARLLVASVIVVVVTAQNTCPEPANTVPLPSPLPPALTSALASFRASLGAILARAGGQSMYATIVYDQDVIFSGGAGTMSRDDSRAPDGDTVYRIGSVTKVFTAMEAWMLQARRLFRWWCVCESVFVSAAMAPMAVRAQEAGLVALDDPVSSVLPRYLPLPLHAGLRGASLSDLASHMAGLPRDGGSRGRVGAHPLVHASRVRAPCVLCMCVCVCGGGGGRGAAPCDPFACNVTLDEVLDIIAGWVLLSDPGTVPSYSNLGFSLLGRGLEAVTGAAWEAFVARNITAPLGMASTSCSVPTEPGRMATGYWQAGAAVAPLGDLGFSNPAGVMYSTGNDFARLLSLFFRCVCVGGGHRRPASRAGPLGACVHVATQCPPTRVNAHAQG